MDVGETVQWSPWGLAVVALLGLSGCLPADRGWVQEQLAVMQAQMAVVRDRVALVEQQFGRLDPKLDRILAQTEQLASRQIDPAEHPPSPLSPGSPSTPSFGRHQGCRSGRWWLWVTRTAPARRRPTIGLASCGRRR